VHHVVIVRGLDYRILFWNKSAEQLYGWSKEEVLGRSIAELVYADNTEFFAATQTVLNKGEWRGEISQLGKDGNLMLVDAHWSLVLDEIGQPKSIFCINSKITDRI
jgi:PAS domain S-box-containing protein